MVGRPTQSRIERPSVVEDEEGPVWQAQGRAVLDRAAGKHHDRILIGEVIVSATSLSHTRGAEGYDIHVEPHGRHPWRGASEEVGSSGGIPTDQAPDQVLSCDR